MTSPPQGGKGEEKFDWQLQAQLAIPFYRAKPRARKEGVMAYAQSTSVPIERSKAEIERTLAKYGANAFAYASDHEKAMVRFTMKGRQVMFLLPLPAFKDYQRSPSGRAWHSSDGQQKAWEQACKSRWRSLALAIKAKLEAVESGITTFEDEFLSHILLPNGRTAGDWLKPQIADAYQNNKMPPLLGYSGGA